MAEPWKDAITPQSVGELGAAVHTACPDFDAGAFQRAVIDSAWDSRALMDRIRHMAAVLRSLLPAAYPIALGLLREAAPRMDGFDLQNLVFPQFVGAYGLANWDASMAALEQFTQQTTGEFAVRPFILADQGRMLAQMLAWTHHASHHVRRLASEGSRPRLPWGVALKGLIRDPKPLVPILEALKEDESDYVRKSVANSLNEIAKDHADFAITWLRPWQEQGSTDTRWIVKHALRTLVKRGHPDALELLGFPAHPEVAVRRLRVQPERVPWGHSVTFAFDLVSTGDEEQDVVIDFVVYLLRANGTHTPKVFKLAQRSIGPGAVFPIEKRFSFRPVSSRRYYPGAHAIAPKVNGKEYGRVDFVLEETSDD